MDGFNAGATEDIPVGGLAGLTTYHFRAEARQGSAGAEVDGADAQFTTGPIPTDGTAGWVTPIISSDSTGSWFNLSKVMDDNDATYAQCLHQINSGQGWSPYIYLQTPAVLANGLRVVAPSSLEQTKISVDISSAGVWTNVYEDVISGALVVGFATMTVSNARVKVNAVTDGTGFYWQFNEFDFRAYTTPPPAAIVLSSTQGFSIGQIVLSWNAPGDYGNKAGTTAKQYDIRYTTTPAKSPAISDALFNADSSIAPGLIAAIPAPNVQGTPESLTLSGLPQGVTYYFAIKARNEIPLWSLLSNGATAYAQIPVRGVSVDKALYLFGTVPVGTSTYSTTAVNVTNSGNIASTYSLSVATTTAGSPWSIGTALPTAPNVVVVFGAFNAALPAPALFGPEDVLTTVSQASTIAKFSINGTQTGVAVPVGAARALWFGVAMPTTSSTVQSQDMTVTITAGP